MILCVIDNRCVECKQNCERSFQKPRNVKGLELGVHFMLPLESGT
jgi:hypothetical protein